MQMYLYDVNPYCSKASAVSKQRESLWNVDTYEPQRQINLCIWDNQIWKFLQADNEDSD